MKKSQILSLLLILTVSNAFCQYGIINNKVANTLLKSKTYVVLKDSADYKELNNLLKEKITANWNLTEFQIIRLKDLTEEMKSNINNSFLTGFKMNRPISASFGGGGVSMIAGGIKRFEGIGLVQGGYNINLGSRKIFNSYVLLQEIDSVELYDYRFELALNTVQNKIKEFASLDDQEIINENGARTYFKKKNKDIGQSTLYLIKEDLHEKLNTDEKVGKVYKNPFKTINRNQFKKLSELEKSNSYLLIKHEFYYGWYFSLIKLDTGEAFHLSYDRNAASKLYQFVAWKKVLRGIQK